MLQANKQYRERNNNESYGRHSKDMPNIWIINSTKKKAKIPQGI